MIDLSFFKTIRSLSTEIVKEHDSFNRYLRLEIADIVPKDVIATLTIDNDGNYRDICVGIPPVKVCSVSYNEKMERISRCIVADQACLFTRGKLVALRFRGIDEENDRSSIVMEFRVYEVFKAYKFMHYIFDVKLNRNAILWALEALSMHPNIIDDEFARRALERIREIVELVTML